MCGKYMSNNVGFEDVIVKENDSSLWKNLGNLWHMFAQFLYWSIGDGANIDVLCHCWVELGMKLMDINADCVNTTSYHFRGLIGSTWSMKCGSFRAFVFSKYGD